MTLIEKLAGNKHRIGWDEAVDPTHPPTNEKNKSMYQLILCKHGTICEYDNKNLLWHCTSRRIGQLLLPKYKKILNVQNEFDDGWTFIVNVNDFSTLAKISGARTKRKLSDEHKKALQDGLAKHKAQN
jgi:hypothetical protein|tara:strand:- start:103 stop:486 length:384 start_codon:yes stop_codon:yes gene_type:complete